MNLPKQVEIVEVSPRDGLQMLPGFVPTADKIALIENLKQAGLRRIEAVSFVNPKAVPQMADAREIIAAIGNDPNIDEVALALNERGYKAAIDANVDWICYVIAGTETMASKNANTTMRDGLDTCKKAIADAHAAGIKVRGSLAVTWICPYEGVVPKERILDITANSLMPARMRLRITIRSGARRRTTFLNYATERRSSFPINSFLDIFTILISPLWQIFTRR